MNTNKRETWAAFNAERQIKIDIIDLKEILSQLRGSPDEWEELNTAPRGWISFVRGDNKGTFRYSERGSWAYLTVNMPGVYGEMKAYKAHIYKSKEELDNRAFQKNGSTCKAKLGKAFKEMNGGISLNKAFGLVDSAEYKNNVPKSLYYSTNDRRLLFRNLEGVQYIDVSSMFAACARGRLPDARTAIRIEGRAEPSEEYPFAYYLKSHHVAEYGTFDTREYLEFPKDLYNSMCYTDSKIAIYNEVPDSEEVTVLMQPSEYELTEAFEQMFRERNEYGSDAKAIMVKSIGAMHRNPRNLNKDRMNDYYHIAAVILARANAKMFDMVEKISEKNYPILSCVVDSIMYIGPENFGVNQKALGEFFDEFHGPVRVRMCGINRYAVEKDGKIQKVVLSGVKNSEALKKSVKKLEDIDQYCITKGRK